MVAADNYPYWLLQSQLGDELEDCLMLGPGD
jgi:hypothetical protein